MNREDIIRMALEAGANLGAESYVMHERCFERFAALVATTEREACAKVCDDWPIGRDDVYSIGKAIRDRGEQVKNLTPEQLSFRAGYEQGRFDAQVERNARVSGNAKDNSVSFDEGVLAERQRIVNLLMIQHEAANGSHNYWHVAANLIQAEGEQK